MKNQLSSPLVSAANNIVSLGTSSKRSIVKVQREFNDFIRFLDIENKNIENIKLPKKEEIKKLASINVSNSFGNSGNLLSNLMNGSFDVSQFLGDMFPTRGRQGRPQNSAGIKPQKPLSAGNNLKFTGIRSLGIVNAIFAGLDFSTGLQEGEGIGKAAAGAGGSLAGSLLGGAIGQTLIPVPGLGFVLGSMAGGFLGGWTADRATELATGGGGEVSSKLKKRLKEQEEKEKSAVGKDKTEKVVTDFGESVSKFEEFVYKTFASVVNAAASAVGSDEMMLDYGLDPESILEPPALPGNLEEMTAEGGKLPSSSIVTSGYGWRWGRQHGGVDYGENTGTPISVIQPGTVSYAGWNDGGYGNLVLVSHPGGTTTAYAHLDSINVKSGQQIEPGTVIGKVGSTGRSTGPHLHFEVRQAGKQIPITGADGDKYFRFGGNVKAKPKSGASGKPTAVLMAGTNDYNNLSTGTAGINKAIKELQSKGYDVVVVPPSEQGQFSGISKAVQEAAVKAGAKIEKGQYDVENLAQITRDSANAIQQKYKGATFIGDGNAQLISGAKSYAGRGSNYIADQIRTTIPTANQRHAIGGPDLTEAMIAAYNSGKLDNISQNASYYPSYNQSQSSVTIMPMYIGGGQGQVQQVPVFIPSGGGGGGGMMILPGPNRGDVVNSLMKTMLLTNLSGT